MSRAATAAVSSPPASVPSLTGHMTDEERAEYAHSIGYRQIGKDLPRGTTLQQVISTMPKEVRVSACTLRRCCSEYQSSFTAWERIRPDSKRCPPSISMSSSYACQFVHWKELICLNHVLQVFELNPVRAWGAVLTSIVSMAASLYLISISPWYLLPLAWALSGTAFTGVSAAPLCSVLPACSLHDLRSPLHVHQHFLDSKAERAGVSNSR